MAITGPTEAYEAKIGFLQDEVAALKQALAQEIERLHKEKAHLEAQIKPVADYLLMHHSDEIQDEGACGMAVRLLTQYREGRGGFDIGELSKQYDEMMSALVDLTKQHGEILQKTDRSGLLVERAQLIQTAAVVDMARTLALTRRETFPIHGY